MGFLWGILSSLTATALVAGIVARMRRQRERTGEVAGYWLQVTYEVGDTERKKPARSVELLELRHHRADLTGTMWRLYCSDYAKRWSFVGRSEHGVVSGVYWATRDPRGGFGSLLMTQEDRWLYSGEFFWTVYERSSEDGELHVTRRPEPLEWIALQGCHDVGVQKIVQRYLENGNTEYLPVRCRAVLGIEPAYWRARIREALANGSGLFSPQPLVILTHTRKTDEGKSDLTRSLLVDEPEPTPDAAVANT